MVRKKGNNIPVYVVLTFAVLAILLPFYMSIVTAFKTPLENMQSFFSLPSSFYLGNFQTILARPDYYRAVVNTVYVTTLSVLGMIILMPAASFAIARKLDRSKAYRILYFFMLLGIFVPFQVKMIPMVRLASSMGLMNPEGIIILYIASSVCECIFLYVGYIQSIPTDLEEAAYIDGASTFRIYIYVILPLIKPMIATVAIKDALWIWNDFMLPLLILNKSNNYWTLTLFQYNFKSAFSTDPTLIVTSFLLSMLPILIAYLFAQKYIIGGLVSGGVKA
jgi:raffinose/stachyose/melibiose transport system permease protein